ncbi:MAG: ATP-binding cassette domain-containing protein, partial [Candidatus Desulfacyla sp.]
RYSGNEDLFLNGLTIHKDRIYHFSKGSTIKVPKGKPLYYSDVASHFLSELVENHISFTVKNIEYHFRNGDKGLQNINFSAIQGNLIGILGASGSGKTTLLNVLSGINKPSSGEVLVNGINVHEESEELNGVIGYVPQDDLLIEELTVFENLYYSAKLCFRDMEEAGILQKVKTVLANFGLENKENLKVGSPFNKTISGGQRKRLNIALELIREPSVLFVDEPTSGLSSRDSENVMDLLRELTLKGKLIFVVIHQPSSEIFKMFDNVMILDAGGYMVYSGNPVEAVMYFKRLDAQINQDMGECPVCGNVNPIKYLRSDEDYPAILASLRQLATLDFGTIFCSLLGVVDPGKAALRRKIEVMERLEAHTLQLHRQGLSPRIIRKRLLGGEGAMRWVTGGHYAKQNTIDSILKGIR